MSGDDGLRGLLAHAVPGWVGLTDDEPLRLADALLPVVTAYAERRARKRAAEKLTTLAFSLLDLGLPNLVFERIVAARDALAAGDRTGQP